MKIWTYQEASNKLQVDLSIQDEEWIKQDELAGYFNEALTEAEAEIIALNEDYLLTKYYLPLASGTSRYALPANIFANKMRDFIYSNGSVIYPITRYRRRGKFSNMAFTDQYGQADDYRYLLVNDGPGQAQLELHPAARETAILPPTSPSFTPAVMWYIRNCARVPLIGEYCNPEVVASSSVNIVNESVAVLSGTSTYGVQSQGVIGCFPGSIVYVTGDAVKLKALPGGTLPAPLVEGTVYYLDPYDSTDVAFCTSAANAAAGSVINLTTQGTIGFVMQVACTTAIQNAVLLDIPEFSTFILQWAKCRVMVKEPNPFYSAEVDTLAALKKSMIDTLTNGIQDDDDEVQADFTHYQEMS